MSDDGRDVARRQSWRRLLAALAVLAVGLASVGGAVLWALDEMRDAHRRADAAEHRATINSQRIDQLERFITDQQLEVPPPPTPTTTTAPVVRSAPRRPVRRSPSTTTTQRPAAPTTQPTFPTSTTTAPPSTTTTRPCVVSIPGACL